MANFTITIPDETVIERVHYISEALIRSGQFAGEGLTKNQRVKQFIPAILKSLYREGKDMEFEGGRVQVHEDADTESEDITIS